MRDRRRPGYADVMATVAVFLALGGTSYAVATGSIGSRQIKDNAVRSVDGRDRSLRAKDFRRGQLLAGAPGSQGPKATRASPARPRRGSSPT